MENAWKYDKNMIVSAIQKGGMIYIYDENGRVRTMNGLLVGYTASNFSFVTSKYSKLVQAYDDKLRRIRSFNAPERPIKD